MTVEEFLAEWNNDKDRILVHTSGSTGKPKPMWVEKRRMEASARITCDFLGLQPGDKSFLCLPVDYIAGKMMVVRAITRGLTLQAVEPLGHPLRVLLGKKAAEREGKQEEKVESEIWTDLAAMVPLQVYNSLQVEEETKLLRGIKNLIIGGGAIDCKLEDALKNFPNAVWSTYGMTETLSHIAMRRINGPQASQWYTPLDNVNLKTDADGCLIINAPLVAEGEIHTNDMVEMAPDGKRFRVIGRKDNVICSGGIKIQIEEAEQLLRPHLNTPFMLTKGSDERLGEAAILLTEETDIEKIRTICEDNLPRLWRPRKIVHIDHIPTTPTGKPARGEAEKYFSNSI